MTIKKKLKYCEDVTELIKDIEKANQCIEKAQNLTTVDEIRAHDCRDSTNYFFPLVSKLDPDLLTNEIKKALLKYYQKRKRDLEAKLKKYVVFKIKKVEE